MSGHSKWHSIRHKKGAIDAKRGKIFTKLAKNITIAARNGGDPEMNPSLKLAIDKAKAANMPNSNIDRAVKAGTGEAKDGVIIQEIMYEGYGPAGVALFIRALTENRNRTVTSIRTIFTKKGGSLGESGSVGYQFTRKGSVEAEMPSTMNTEEIELFALEHGADDLQHIEGQLYMFITAPESAGALKDALEEHKATIKDVSIIFTPQNTVNITDIEDAQKIITVVDALEDDDDVDAVFSNFVIDDSIVDQLA